MLSFPHIPAPHCRVQTRYNRQRKGLNFEKHQRGAFFLMRSLAANTSRSLEWWVSKLPEN